MVLDQIVKKVVCEALERQGVSFESPSDSLQSNAVKLTYLQVNDGISCQFLGQIRGPVFNFKSS